MFKKVREPKGNVVTIYFEDQPVQAEEGITVAAAVLNPAEGWTRTSPIRPWTLVILPTSRYC